MPDIAEEWPKDEKIMVFKLSEVKEIASLLFDAGIDKEKVRDIILNRYYSNGKNLEKLHMYIYNFCRQAILTGLEETVTKETPEMTRLYQ